MELFVALLAILVPLVLLVGFRLPARVGMPVAMTVVALSGFALWGMSGLVIAASALQGAHRTLSILWILFGAITFLFMMQRSGLLHRITDGFYAISKDMRVLAVLVAFAFVSIIEGVSGFGAPAIIAVPLLMSLGFRPITSVVLALAGDSVATSFGAVGTPLLIGLGNVPSINPVMVGQTITVVDFLTALFVPMLVVGLAVLSNYPSSVRSWWGVVRETLPWALSVGAVYALSALIVSHLLGPEFVSVISGAATLIYGTISAKKSWLLGDTEWQEYGADKRVLRPKKHEKFPLWLAWLPYGLVIGGLLLQRTIPPLRSWLAEHLNLSWNHILSFDSIQSSWQFLLSPGTLLAVVALGFVLYFHRQISLVPHITLPALRKISISAAALFPTLIMVQIFVNSGINNSGLPSMPHYIADVLAALVGPFWLAVAPLLGMMAAFITGSSTVSTLTMSPIQLEAALDIGLNQNLVMAAQVSGSNAGNIIAVHNVVAATTIAELHHQEGHVIRKLVPAAAAYMAVILISLFVVSRFY